MSQETWNMVRMSTEYQEDSPATQDDQTGVFIRQNNLPAWTRTYFDLGESAGSMDRRQGILTMIADAERLRPAVIVFYKLDRAFRNSNEQGYVLNKLKKLGVRVLKVRDPNIDGPQGNMVDGILGVVNQFERELIGMRIRDHNLTMARQGLWTGGSPPFGYSYRPSVREQRGSRLVTVEQGRLEPDPLEWPACRQLWDWALDGYRLSEIAALAAAAGIRRRNGGLWTYDLIGRLFSSRVYAGFIPYSIEPLAKHRPKRNWSHAEWYPGQHQSMVTLEEWYRVQTALAANVKGTKRTPNQNARVELAGLIRCKICGGPVGRTSHDSSNAYYYGCYLAGRRGAAHERWSRTPWLVHMAVQAVFDQAALQLPPEGKPATEDDQREAIQREIARLQIQRKRLRDLYLMGEFENDKAEYQRRARDLDLQTAAKETQLAQAGPSAEAMTRNWERLRNWEQLYLTAKTVQERKRVWASLVESIRMDKHSMTVTLTELGEGVARVWEVDLPPANTRRGNGKAVGSAAHGLSVRPAAVT